MRRSRGCAPARFRTVPTCRTTTSPMRCNGSFSPPRRRSSICWRFVVAGSKRWAAMDYISTRGSAPTLDFRAATLAGLASDGGLYVPAQWPRLSEDEIRALAGLDRSEEHTSELQSLMRISYAVFCLKKKNQYLKQQNTHNTPT